MSLEQLAARLKERFLGVIGVEALEFFGREWHSCPVLAVWPGSVNGRPVLKVQVRLWGNLQDLCVYPQVAMQWLEGPYGQPLVSVDSSFRLY